jgi:holo-[acyl-carrier protein] synthase
VILALGADLVEIARVRRLLARHGERALKRLFHEEELAYALALKDPAPSLAARLAAKEAFQKCWPESLSWKSVWVGMEGRRPALRFAPALEAALRERGLTGPPHPEPRAHPRPGGGGPGQGTRRRMRA